MSIIYVIIAVVSVGLLWWIRSSGKEHFANSLVAFWSTLAGAFLGVQFSLIADHRRNEQAYGAYIENIILRSPSLHLAADLDFYYEKIGDSSQPVKFSDLRRKPVDFDFSSGGRSALIQRFATFDPKTSDRDWAGEKFETKEVMDSVQAYFQSIEDLLRSDTMIKMGSKEAYRSLAQLMREFKKSHAPMLHGAFYLNLASRESLRKLIVRTEAVLACELLMGEGALARKRAKEGIQVAGFSVEQPGEEISFEPCREKVIERLREIGHVEVLK